MNITRFAMKLFISLAPFICNIYIQMRLGHQIIAYGGKGYALRPALKPQNSFGRFVKNLLDLQKVGPYHQKAPLNPPATIVLNDML